GTPVVEACRSAGEILARERARSRLANVLDVVLEVADFALVGVRVDTARDRPDHDAALFVKVRVREPHPRRVLLAQDFAPDLVVHFNDADAVEAVAGVRPQKLMEVAKVRHHAARNWPKALDRRAEDVNKRRPDKLR